MSNRMQHAIAECKELRSGGMCPRECKSWHPAWRGAKDFCGFAMAAERRNAKRKAKA